MFVTVMPKGYTHPLHVAADAIESFNTTAEGQTLMFFKHDHTGALTVNETPNELLQQIAAPRLREELRLQSIDRLIAEGVNAEEGIYRMAFFTVILLGIIAVLLGISIAF